MPKYYRGAGIGTYWHGNDARLLGLTAHWPAAPRSHIRFMEHIARGTTRSPYISLTRSYGVAWCYAVYSGQDVPGETNPAFVYEVEVDDPLPQGVVLLDPIKEVAGAVPEPTAGFSYQHDGDNSFLLGVIDPRLMKDRLSQQVRFPPGANATPRSPTLSVELETLVRALRDAEILAVGAIPANVITRIEVW